MLIDNIILSTTLLNVAGTNCVLYTHMYAPKKKYAFESYSTII